VNTSPQELREYYVLYEILEGGVLKDHTMSSIGATEDETLAKFKAYMDDYDMCSKEFTILKVYEPRRNYGLR